MVLAARKGSRVLPRATRRGSAPLPQPSAHRQPVPPREPPAPQPRAPAAGTVLLLKPLLDHPRRALPRCRQPQDESLSLLAGLNASRSGAASSPRGRRVVSPCPASPLAGNRLSQSLGDAAGCNLADRRPEHPRIPGDPVPAGAPRRAARSVWAPGSGQGQAGNGAVWPGRRAARRIVSSSRGTVGTAIPHAEAVPEKHSPPRHGAAVARSPMRRCASAQGACPSQRSRASLIPPSALFLPNPQAKPC